ncbi:MAG: FkbM family methyltransferase [Gemmatimonadaceae bacterium]|nr:FkbM family methyltransferase [Chitinophagaceae bacterium]
MKGLINLESIWRRSLKTLGVYYQWLYHKEKNAPTANMLKMRNFYRQFVEPGSLCFDIGANMGSRVGTFLMLKARVIALEPQKQCVEQLQKVYKNEPVTVVQKGVGAKNELKDFYIASNSLVSSFSTDWIDGMKKKLKDRWDKVEKVEIVTLDQLIEEYGTPDFLKIDTEGFELEVLKGLSSTVKFLSFEYTLPEPDNKAIACLHRITELYGGKVRFNIARDEAYSFKFPDWQSAESMIALVSGPDFVSDNFGNYGDIYAIRG